MTVCQNTYMLIEKLFEKNPSVPQCCNLQWKHNLKQKILVYHFDPVLKSWPFKSLQMFLILLVVLQNVEFSTFLETFSARTWSALISFNVSSVS